MGRKAPEPLTTEQAKYQLREAAAHMGIASWVRRQPRGAIATGLLTGFLMGRVPRLVSRVSHSRVGKKVIDRLA